MFESLTPFLHFLILPGCHKSLPESAAVCLACPAHAKAKMTVNQAVGTQGHCLSSGRELLSTRLPGLRWGLPGAVEPSKAFWPRMFPHGACSRARLLVHPADTEVGRHGDKKGTLAGQRVPGPCWGAQAQLRESGIQCPNFVSHRRWGRGGLSAFRAERGWSGGQ